VERFCCSSCIRVACCREFFVWRIREDVVWTLAALAVIGFLFTWWARIYLGSLWSGTVARKEHLRVVDARPYAMVRHPIYGGLILATLATAVIRGTSFGVAGALLMIAGYSVKARLEAEVLREQLAPRHTTPTGCACRCSCRSRAATNEETGGPIHVLRRSFERRNKTRPAAFRRRDCPFHDL
jgi:hypothetical protein